MGKRAQVTKAQLEDIPETDLTRMKIVGRGLFKDRSLRLPLRAMREAIGKTQVELAELADMRQADLSRLERREDVKLSSLKRYVQGLGGQLELVVVFPTGHRIKLAL